MAIRNTPDDPRRVVADPNLPGGIRQRSLQARDAHSFLWAGHIIHVDVESMACSIAIDMGSAKEWHDVPLPAPAGTGPRSWAGCIPEPGTKVLIEWAEFGNRNYRPMIVGFMTAGTLVARQYEPFSAAQPDEIAQALVLAPDLASDPRYRLNTVRMKARKAYSGDFLASSSSGADFILDRDSTLQNRAGNEFKLRDADQTAVLQTINEFVSSAAGFYRRGLIRRNAFNLLPDLLLSVPDREPGNIGDKSVEDVLAGKKQKIQNEDGTWSVVLVDKIDKTSPAFIVLKQFGLVDDSGTVTIPAPTDPVYPFIVTSDGRRQSYVVHGTQDKRFDETDECYVEDRAEIFHTHDAVMSVTEEGDGIQVDNALKRVFIEDVRGTVVGNDPYTDAGRALYKRILSMQMFTSLDDMARPHAEMFAVDEKVPSQADTIALARLFRIKPQVDGGNTYTFGISKEGRVFWSVPASQNGKQSVDMHTLGGIKAVLGCNSDRVSLNLRTEGGIKLDLGSFQDTSSDAQDSVSVDVTFHGKLKATYSGQQGRETIVNGTEYISVGGSHVVNAGGSQVTVCGGTSALEAEGARRNLGTGGYALRSLGSYDITCLDKSSESYAKLRMTTTYTGCTKMTVAGTDATVVTAGAYSVSVVAGTYAVTVGAGALAMTCAGAFTMTSAAAMAMTAGGALNAVAGGAMTHTAGGVNMVAGATVVLMAPIVKVGALPVGNILAAVPGPPSPARDYITGLPLLGVPTIFVG